MSTTTRRRSITKTHERISQLGWEPTYHEPAVRYPSRYTFPTKAKDPMKHIMREYLPMELEKDERVYGGHDAAVRAEMTSKTEPRWLEILKPYIVTTAYAEVAAGRCMSMLIDAVPNNELRNGYHVQFVDEVRHTGMQMALARWYAKHVPDPAGWHLARRRCRATPPPARRSTCSRTSWSAIGPVRIHAPGRRRDGLHEPGLCRAARRSREKRRLHAADHVPVRAVGRGTPHLERLRHPADRSPGRRQRAADRARPAAGMVDQPRVPGRLRLGDHGVLVKDRSDPESYLDKWDQWVRDDWYRSYVLKLGRLGLELPADMFERARERSSKGLVHKNILGGGAFWMLHFWRTEAIDQNDFEWFESKYPGWYAEYGEFYETLGKVSKDPEGFAELLRSIAEQGTPSCWTCPDELRPAGGHVSPRGGRPHALLLLQGVHVAGRVEPRSLYGRPQLPRPSTAGSCRMSCRTSASCERTGRP